MASWNVLNPTPVTAADPIQPSATPWVIWPGGSGNAVPLGAWGAAAATARLEFSVDGGTTWGPVSGLTQWTQAESAADTIYPQGFWLTACLLRFKLISGGDGDLSLTLRYALDGAPST